MSGTRYTMFSGGEGSFRAAKIDRAHHPDAPFGLVFTDTLYEDPDTYRFLIEAAANVIDRPAPAWLPHANDFPDYRIADDVPIEEYHGAPAWRTYLAQLRERAAEHLPEMVWLVEGRDPWEVFRDERYIGNSRADPCSKVLKRAHLDRWRNATCDPATDTFAIGIGEHERHRINGASGKPGLRARMSADGWVYHAPLVDADQLDHPSLFYAPVDQLGVRPQRLYGLRYMHANCGGFCVKAGLAHWQNRRRVQPERFAYDAMMERKLRAFIGSPDATILRDRSRGAAHRALTLDSFAARLNASPELAYDYRPGESGCGCMVDA